MLLGIFFNVTLIFIFYTFLRETKYVETGEVEQILIPWLHDILYYASISLLVLGLPLYIITACMDPGYLKPFYNYMELIEEAIDLGLNLSDLCSYCQVIKSETSFHCTICNKCIENFDHHCPFVNSCLGYRTHKYFFFFVVLYTLFLTVVLGETIRHFVEMF